MATDVIRKEIKELQTYTIVFFCFLVIMLEGFDIQAAGVAAPRLVPDMGLLPEQVGTFFSSSGLGVLIFAALGGILADRFGRKPVLVASTLAFGLFSLLTPFCWNFESLVVVRFLTGAGLGAAFPAVIALTSDHSPASQKKRWVGIVYCAISLGGMLAAGVIATGWFPGWQQVFYVGGVLPMVTALAMAFYLPHTPIVAKKAVETASWRDILGPNKLAITLSLWVATFLTLAVMYVLVLWLPSLMAAKGLSRPDAAVVQMLFNLGSTVAAFATGYALDKKYVYSVPAVGYVILAVVLVTLGLMPVDLFTGTALGFLLGIGVTTGQTLLYAYAPLCYPAGVRSTGTGYAIAAGRVGTIVGPFAAGVLLATGLSAGQVLAVIAPVAIITMLVVFLVAWLMSGASGPSAQKEGKAA